MIDLHLHTTASDGTLTPSELVSRASHAGLTVISITDHDTTAAFDEANDAAGRAGLTLVPGVEITAVENSRDVHLLGYFIDPHDRPLAEFLERQRADRLQRIVRMGKRLQELGYPIDPNPLLADAARSGGRSVGRPAIAAALIAAGHVQDPDEAFDRLLGDEGPAFIPRSGESPEAVIDIIRRARGIASLAHPALLRMDHLIPRLAGAGLAAVEVRHSDHDEAAERRYRALASEYGLLVSGGSDFHGDCGRRAGAIGTVTLPREDFDRLQALVA